MKDYKAKLIKGANTSNREYRCRICDVKYPTDKHCEEYEPGKYYSHDFILKEKK